MIENPGNEIATLPSQGQKGDGWQWQGGLEKK